MSQTDQEQRILDGSLWADFCDSLKLAGEQVLRDTTPDDAFNRAEGYRYLTRLLRLSLEKNIEYNDPRFPEFYSLSHETAKIGNDNPDNFYQNCAISGNYDYRIKGHRGSIPYLSIETKAGSYGTTGGMAPTGHLELEELDILDDGTFEIIVSTTRQPGNWLPMTPESDNLLVRQTYQNRAQETRATLHIECLNPRGESTLEPHQFAEQLDNVTGFISGTAGLFIEWMENFRQHTNQLPANDQQLCLSAGGDPSIHYHNSYWKLAEDEALVIEVDALPQCRTWNFQLSNYWMESLDYRYDNISVNKHTARYGEDGSLCIVVAHQDPGIEYPNWISTAGHTLGSMLFRYIEADWFPPIKTRVVKFGDL
ncbi:MAG: DUF1214 domain-containing protein [Gammaproteobacteria bacterium]|nr:DUF1214 domain-containing protein [Gammaproteobacteria bacterium]